MIISCKSIKYTDQMLVKFQPKAADSAQQGTESVQQGAETVQQGTETANATWSISRAISIAKPLDMVQLLWKQYVQTPYDQFTIQQLYDFSIQFFSII